MSADPHPKMLNPGIIKAPVCEDLAMPTDSTEVRANIEPDAATLFGSKKCFIVCPIGKDDSDERKRSDKIKRHIIDKAVVPMGYQTVRADLVDKSGSITTQIVSDLIDADLVIADLTGHNPNVFYELAIRHAFANPFIQIIEDGEIIPFDVSAYRTVMINHRDLDSAEAARISIEGMIRDIENGGIVESPVVHAINRQSLGQSINPEKQEIAQISATVERIERQMRAREVDEVVHPRQLLIQRELIRLLVRMNSDKSSLIWDELSKLEKLASGDANLTKLVATLKDDAIPF